MNLRKSDIRRISTQLNNLADSMDDAVLDLSDGSVLQITDQNRQAYAFYSHLRDMGW